MPTSRSQSLILTPGALDAMIAHCVQGAALACCGILAGIPPTAAAVYPLRNAAKSRARYHAERRDVLHAVIDLRGWGLTMVAIYHFRPGLAAVPSRTDLRKHAYGDLPRVIVALGEVPTVRVWRLTKRYCEELNWHLQPPEDRSASRDVQRPIARREVGRDDGVKKLPGFLGSVLSRMFWKPHTSARIPIRLLQDYPPLEPDPMWDPSLDNPRQRGLPDE
jgi:proteasome lid subunit RPN8/RPN11